jgi:hypothetical protein
MWLIISLLNLWLLGPSSLRLLGSLLLRRSNLWLLESLQLGHYDLRPRSGHLLLALIVQSLKKGIMSVSRSRCALLTKTTIKYIK